MKAFHKRLFTGLLALGLGASAIAADVSMCGPMGDRGHGMGWADGQGSAKQVERIQLRMNQYHAALHEKLKLNAEQEVAWKAFIAGAVPTALPARMNRDEMLKLSSPERMEKMLGVMKDREARMTVRLVELKKFYAVLTSAQQKIFDAEIGQHHRFGHGRGKPKTP